MESVCPVWDEDWRGNLFLSIYFLYNFILFIFLLTTKMVNRYLWFCNRRCYCLQIVPSTEILIFLEITVIYLYVGHISFINSMRWSFSAIQIAVSKCSIPCCSRAVPWIAVLVWLYPAWPRYPHATSSSRTSTSSKSRSVSSGGSSTSESVCVSGFCWECFLY